MNKVAELYKAEAEKHKTAARTILDRVDADLREIKPEEKAEVEAHLDEYKRLMAKASAELDLDTLRKGLGENGVAEAEQVAMNAESRDMTVGEAFVRSATFKAIQARSKAGTLGEFRSEAVRIDGTAWRGGRKAAVPIVESDNTPLFGTGGDAGALTTLGGLETPGFIQPPLTIADLLPSVPVTVGNSATYPVVKTRNVADTGTVGEGSGKPDASWDFDVETKVLEKIAAFTKISSEFLEDAPALVAYINADLPLMVRQNEEAKLVAGLYDGATAYDGSGIIASPNVFDAILEAVTAVQTAGFNPNVIVISPIDWATMLATKLISTGEYVAGGPFESSGRNPWNLRVVISQSAQSKLPLVGDFSRGAKVYRKGGLSVDSTNSNEDDFKNNLVAFRAEMRFVLGKTYPEAFATADIS